MQDDNTPQNSNEQIAQNDPNSSPSEIKVTDGSELVTPVEQTIPLSPEGPDQPEAEQTAEEQLVTKNIVQSVPTPAQPMPLVEIPPVQAALSDNNPKPHTKKPLLLIGIFGVIIAAIFVAVIAYFVMSAGPAKKLEAAIINTASTKGLQQEYVVDGKVNDTDLKGSVVVRSDFSDPAVPKSTGNFAIDVSVFGIAIRVKSDFTCVSANECYVKYNEFTIPEELTTEEPAFLGKWLKFNPSDDTAATADPFSLLTGINTVLGEIITGNISGSAKQQIEEAAKNGSAYDYTAHSKESLNGVATDKYTMKLQKDAILQLNKAVADQYSIPNSFTDAADFVDGAEIWIDSATDNIVKIYYEKEGVKSTITYSKFNEIVEIKAPDVFLNPDEYNQII